MSSPTKALRPLDADHLYKTLRKRFASVPDHRPDCPQTQIGLSDALMAAFALFTLKDPSLLAFDQRRSDPSQNLSKIFGMQNIPCDTQMRTILDPVDPQQLRGAFTDVFSLLQRSHVLKDFRFLGDKYIISLDGTGYFSSGCIHCENCLSRTSSNGKTTYYHQGYCASLVHPDRKEVIPLMPEPIVKQDGTDKNDCERNAAKRWLTKFRQDHPQLNALIVADGLSSNAPYIQELLAARCDFLLVAKPSDHKFLFEHLEQARLASLAEEVTFADDDGTIHHFRWLKNVPLNESNQDVLVNVLEYWCIRDGQVQSFSWVTNLDLSEEIVWDVMRAGRSRWKIENETFNTLKNQGYHYEHNFGHGQEQLSVVLMVLMMLAFLVDQVQQLCNPLFAQAWEKLKSKRRLWERLRALFEDYLFSSMQAIYEAMAFGIVPQEVQLQVQEDSS